MLEASVLLYLSKDHTITRHHVTPIEATLLVAEHQPNVGKCPIEVIAGTIKELPEIKTTEKKLVKVGTKKEGENEVDVMKEKVVEITRSRTDDEELDRLRQRYAPNKVQAVASSAKQLPTTFEDAFALGGKISMPHNRLSETKLV